MGADGWKVSLLHDGAEVTSRHAYIDRSRTGKGYYLPHKYHPWCATRPAIALNAWDGILRIYDVLQLRSWERSVQFPLEIQWSPQGETLAVTLDGRITLLDAGGELIVDIPCERTDGQATCDVKECGVEVAVAP